MGIVSTSSERQIKGRHAVYSVLDEFVHNGTKLQLLQHQMANKYFVVTVKGHLITRRRFITQDRAEAVFSKEQSKLIARDNPVAEKVKYEIFKPNKTLTFLLTEQKVLVITHPESQLRQVFIVQYDHHNYAKKLNELREMIKENKVKSITDLVSFCNFHVGSYKDQMAGLELVPTKLERHI